MILCFTLSMPRNNSWNGKWTGESDLYARMVYMGNTKMHLEKANNLVSNSPYHYDFGDGWAASVTVTKVTAPEASKIRKRSKGFCGYDWMIESIRDKGTITIKSKVA